MYGDRLAARHSRKVRLLLNALARCRSTARCLCSGLLADISLLDGALLRSAHHLASLRRVVFERALAGGKRVVGVLRSKIFDLCGLLVEEVGGIVDVLIDRVLVLDVDKRCEERKCREEESEAPWWRNLDEEVS